MSDETFQILRTPTSPPITATEWLAELRSYCAPDEQPTFTQREEGSMKVSFPSRYTLGWKWDEVHPVDAIMHAIDAGALTKTAGNFSRDYTRLLKHRERAAMTPCERLAHDLCEGHPNILSKVDGSDPNHPKILLHRWPNSWVGIQHDADGFQLTVNGLLGNRSAPERAELGPVLRHFDSISYQLHKEISGARQGEQG